jgi:hypothetical protein
MAYITTNMAGVNLSTTYTGTTTDGANAPFKLGTLVEGTDGSRWVFVQAGAAITQYYTVAIDENFQAVHITSTLAKAGYGVGFAQVAFSDNDFGWVCVHAGGNISVRLAASCAADVQLYTTATAGVLDDTATSTACLLRGVVAVVAASNTASTREAIAIYPNATATP